MFFKLPSDDLYFFVILLSGLLTVYTDIRYKKIYNSHLILGAALGACIAGYAVWLEPDSTLPHLVNGATAFLVGWLLYHYKIWRGGDAKLFALYAFLMPSLGHTPTSIACTISLFVCSFVIGMVIILPFFIRENFLNHQSIAKDLFSSERFKHLMNAVLRTVFVSWILFPFYYLARITNPVIILTITCLIFHWGYTTKKFQIFKTPFIELPLGLGFGILMRLWLSPNALTVPALIRYLMIIILSSTISIFISTTIDHSKNYRDRISFAPLLFTGCVLSYTPFLTWLMHTVNQWNALLYR